MSDLFEGLRVFITNTAPRARLDVGGEIDMCTVDALRDHLALLVEAGTGDIDVDMAEVRFCDATVLRVLLAAEQALAAGGRHLQIINPSPPTARLLRLTGLDTTLLAASDQQAARLPQRTCGALRTPADADGHTQHRAVRGGARDPAE